MRLSFEGKRSAFPPLGLLTVSAMLPDAWERRLVDMNVRRLKPSDIEWADMVFASAMIVQKDSLRRVVELCKARGQASGRRRAVCHDQRGGPIRADHVFLGEAETTLPEFVRDLERGDAKRIYKAAERPALSHAPIPDFQLADLKRYSAMSVQYSRGCPFNCEFCDIIEIYGRVPRTKSNEQMLAELDALLQTGLARDGVHRRRQLHRQQAERQATAACTWPSGRSATAARSPSSPKRASTSPTTTSCSTVMRRAGLPPRLSRHRDAGRREPEGSAEGTEHAARPARVGAERFRATAWR